MERLLRRAHRVAIEVHRDHAGAAPQRLEGVAPLAAADVQQALTGAQSQALVIYGEQARTSS